MPETTINPRDNIKHDDVGTPVWPEPLHVEPVRLDRALWSHSCIAIGRRIWKSRSEPCEACGAREIR
jgi:hypothetical protein